MKDNIKNIMWHFLLAFIVFLLIDVLFAVLSGKHIKIVLTEWSIPKRYDWSMQGYLISEDGTILDTTTFSIKGKVWKGGEKLEYSFEMPDNFTYQFTANQKKSNNLQEVFNEEQYCAPYPTYEAQLYEAGTERYVICNISIDFKNQIMILRPIDTKRNYIVASADPTVTPESLTVHFEDFLNVFGWK